MAKLTLNDLASLTNETSAIATINNNNAAIETALENTLSRDGTTPNTMSADLDINTHRILNLAQATTAGHAVEYTQLQDRVDEMQTLHDETETLKNQASSYADDAFQSKSDAQAAEVESEALLAEMQALFDSYNNQYLGTFASEPTVDNDGNTLTVGDLYYDSITLSFRVWDGTNWQDVASLTPSSTNTLSNKSIDLSDNTITGTLSEFNTALTDADFVSIAGIETLTNKTLTTPKISSISNTGTLTLPTSTDTLVGRATTDTLTNKSLNLSSNTLTGTKAQFNTAMSDADFATIAGTETLTNKTLTSPVISSPTGIVKADVGLSNVDNTSDATKNAATVTLTNKTIALGSNTVSGTAAQFNLACTDNDFIYPTGGSNLTGGFTATSDGDGTISSGTYTPDPLTGNFKHITANGAFTLAPPSSACTLVIEVTNGASAGTITTSGFTKVSGDTYNTTSTNKFLLFVTKSNSYSHLHIQTLQ